MCFPSWPVVISIILLLVSACSSPGPASVSDREQPPSRKLETHRVSSGETLYSIAWRYGVDYRKLAHHNGVGQPYTIYPGQTLRLDVESGGTPSTASPVSEVARTAPAKPSVQRKPKPSEASGRSINKTPASPAPSAPALVAGPPAWRWPSQGRILSAFGASTGLNKGIDIDGKLGEPVLAAASGQVVYAGSGLRGYGRLVIIKHNDTYLSAYAHNEKLLLSEGDSVKAGDKIAEMGSSGTDKVKLHFEIRRNGKPVDPIRYLPKR